MSCHDVYAVRMYNASIMYIYCRLPIGSTFTMNGQGKKLAIDGFSLDQAYSAMAMWAMIASPLMIGADMRDIAPEFRAVWLNKELIRVNQVSFYLSTRVALSSSSPAPASVQYL
jgi:hypothetical protein